MTYRLTTLFTLSPNTLYGIRQNYFLRTCPSTDATTEFYDRLYKAGASSTNPEQNRYTAFYTTSKYC